MDILIPNRITQSRYECVRERMKELGAPVIQCVEISADFYYALEGSHRITAAKELGLVPTIVIVDTLGFDDEDDDTLTRAIRKDVPVRQSKNLLIQFD